jgi:hypothetical protein
MPIFYVIILSVPLLFTILRERVGKGYEVIDTLSIIFTSILLSLRENTGADLLTYKQNYYMHMNNNFVGGDFSEPGYLLAVKVFSALKIPFTVFLFLIAAFSLFALYYYLENSKLDNKVMPLYIYFTIVDLYVYSLSAIRQGIAISFLLISLVKFNRKQYFRSIIIIVLGTMFHWSVIIMIPMIFLLNAVKRVRGIVILGLTVLIPILYFIGVNSPIIEIIAKFNYNTNYYLNILANERTTNIKSFIWSFILAIIWSLYLIFFRSIEVDGTVTLWKTDVVRQYVELDYNDWCVIIFLILRSCLDIYYISALPRVEMYFYLMLPFTLEKEVEKTKGKVRAFIYVLLAFAFAISFYVRLHMNWEFYGSARFVF